MDRRTMSDADRVQVALSTAEARVEELEGEVARLRTASAALLAALDVHEDATDSVMGEAYHPDHQDAVYDAKAALRAAAKEPTNAR